MPRIPSSSRMCASLGGEAFADCVVASGIEKVYTREMRGWTGWRGLQVKQAQAKQEAPPERSLFAKNDASGANYMSLTPSTKALSLRERLG